ncbi:MAG: NAD-dependent epimerase/dehydratase family protein [Candidatus Aminicenantes bacterium]|nr:NAD-dependent epimerase/dehydratase family protein [Candidatus Aminicenantes bacterium]
MKKALVCGAGGFIGSHLVKRLKKNGCWVRGVDLKKPEFSESYADEFLLLDLREKNNCDTAVTAPEGAVFDEVYQLAADMGGMGFIHSAECEIMRNSLLINIHMIHSSTNKGIKRYFFSSSACVYRDMEFDEPELSEKDAYPALPDNEYGWEKLYSERMAMAYGRRFGMTIRLARFQNCYGPEGTWRGGREKAPAAMCRKIAEAEDGGTIEVWGDGSAMRAYTYIDDMIDGILMLMASDLENGVNIGRQEYVSVDELVMTVAEVAGKKINIKHVEGPVGVKARNFRVDRISAIGWKSKFSLKEGLSQTYPWVKEQVEAYKKGE